MVEEVCEGGNCLSGLLEKSSISSTKERGHGRHDRRRCCLVDPFSGEGIIVPTFSKLTSKHFDKMHSDGFTWASNAYMETMGYFRKGAFDSKHCKKMMKWKR